MLARLAGIVAPIYVVAGLGWWWARSGRRYDTPLVTDLIMTIGAPCLVFASLTGLLLSYYTNVPTGPAIILVSGVGYILSMLIGPRGGLVWQFIHRRHLEA